MKKLSKKRVKEYFKALDSLENDFYDAVNNLETTMKRETGIEGIEFFWVGGEVVGIGNSSRTMKLINRR